MTSFNCTDFPTIALDDASSEIIIIDQTLLPGEVRLLRLSKMEDIWEAIKALRVRGAPAIGVTAGFAAYLAGKSIETDDLLLFEEKFNEAADYLATSRPTAVNLFWALDRMRGVVARAGVDKAFQCTGSDVEKTGVVVCAGVDKGHNQEGAVCPEADVVARERGEDG